MSSTRAGAAGRHGGQVGDVEAAEVVFDKAVGVVVGVGRGLVQILVGDVVFVEVELLLAGWCFGVLGGVGDVGVEGGGVVGEQFDAVGEQAGVFVGPDGLGGGDVVQVFGGGGEQIVRGPVGRR